MKKPEILIIDDEPINLTILRNLLNDFFAVRACKSGMEALRLLHNGSKPDLILLDIMMPGLDGYETLSLIREDPGNLDIPVIYISALDSSFDEEKGFRLGAVDYITKPFRPGIVLERIRVHLELKQARDLLKNHNEWLEAEVARRVKENLIIHDATLNMMLQLIETRDNDTANHILRTRSYIELIGRRLQHLDKYRDVLDDAKLTNIIKASSLHDIGKIGIPDSILLKSDKLTEEEYEVMKKHCRIGSDAISSAMDKAYLMGDSIDDSTRSISQVFFSEAADIAAHHHEKWDGTGYPDKLKGGEIPFSACLMALADVFDALTTLRVYKTPWSIEDAAAYILSQKGKHFAPDIVDAFQEELPSFEITLRSLADTRERGCYEE